MDDDRYADRDDQRGREALLVLLVVLLGGATLIAVADRLLHVGSTLGNILFAALPLVAATIAASRLHHGD